MSRQAAGMHPSRKSERQQPSMLSSLVMIVPRTSMVSILNHFGPNSKDSWLASLLRKALDEILPELSGAELGFLVRLGHRRLGCFHHWCVTSAQTAGDLSVTLRRSNNGMHGPLTFLAEDVYGILRDSSSDVVAFCLSAVVAGPLEPPFCCISTIEVEKCPPRRPSGICWQRRPSKPR